MAIDITPRKLQKNRAYEAAVQTGLNPAWSERKVSGHSEANYVVVEYLVSESSIYVVGTTLDSI